MATGVTFGVSKYNARIVNAATTAVCASRKWKAKCGGTIREGHRHAYNRSMHEVLVYSRKGCHLCDVVKETLTQLRGEADFEWREVDIDADPELCEKYNDEIPVVFIDGRKAFKYHMDGRRFLRALAGAQGAQDLPR